MRSLALILLFANLAPLQCQSEVPVDERPYETPAEALYRLAGEFKKKGRLEAWRMTLKYLIERYPSSRFAVTAKDDLSQADARAPKEHAR